MSNFLYLNENLLDEEGFVIFNVHQRYVVKDGCIENDDGLMIELEKIWVNFEMKEQGW